MVVTLGQRYDVGEKPTVILYTYINSHAEHPKKLLTNKNIVLIVPYHNQFKFVNFYLFCSPLFSPFCWIFGVSFPYIKKDKGVGEAFMKKCVAQPRLPEHARYSKAREMVEKKVGPVHFFYHLLRHHLITTTLLL